MCGIAGYFGPRTISDDAAGRCLNLMYRRGPDASGVYRYACVNGRNVLILNRRLAIIDLDERANQPYRHRDKVISLNGEIYNYLELRQELAARGRGFTSDSDTEVLIQLIDCDGWAALSRAEGMWGFAMW